MKPFKFFTKSFNPRDYDIEGFTFIGVSPIKNDVIDNREYRVMIYMDNRTNTPILANRIREDEEPYHQADIIQVIDNRIYQLPRRGVENINVILTFTPNETI
jgi:hypothetical protein